MTFDELFVKDKLKELDTYFKEIEDILTYPDSEIQTNISKLRHAERSFQLAVDTTIDINQHFIKEFNLPTSDDFQGTFLILSENRILPRDFAQRLAPAVGLRNRIVHRYEKVDKEVFVNNLRKHFKDFDEYMKYIYAYLQKKI